MPNEKTTTWRVTILLDAARSEDGAAIGKLIENALDADAILCDLLDVGDICVEGVDEVTPCSDLDAGRFCTHSPVCGA
jgi:hypothetical protein